MPAISARERSGAPSSAATAEAWTRLAWLPLLALLACAIYLGSRPGGVGPVVVYERAPFAIALVSLFALAAAMIASALRRPFLRPGRFVAFAALSSSIVAASLPFAYPTSHARRPSAVVFGLPVAGEWIVRCGGEGWRENVLALQPARCRGFDFVRAGPAPSPDGASSDAVYAPAAGRVVRAHDGERDLAAQERWDGDEPLGNHVVLEVAAGEFLFLTNLRRGSIEVSEGEQVRAGARLAQVGSSGVPPVITAGPYLGIHLQDALHGPAEGIPFAFTDYEVDGRPVARGVPRGGVGLDGTPKGDRIRSSAVGPGEPAAEGPD